MEHYAALPRRRLSLVQAACSLHAVYRLVLKQQLVDSLSNAPLVWVLRILRLWEGGCSWHWVGLSALHDLRDVHEDSLWVRQHRETSLRGPGKADN